MARMLLKDTCELAAEILDGKHDENLGHIIQAAQARTKTRFRKGQRVTIVACRDKDLIGREATILKVNVKTISVGVGEEKTDFYPVHDLEGKLLDEGRVTYYADGEWNFPHACLAPVSA